MGKTHYVGLMVFCEMEEMDGSSEQSAEIAMNLVQELCDKHLAFGEVVVVGHTDGMSAECFTWNNPCDTRV
jgi:hypothetical protein